MAKHGMPFALAFMALLLAIACGGGGSTPTPSPTRPPAVVLSSPTPEPTLTTVPGSLTPPPESGGMDGFRAFAALIDAALAEGDGSLFADRGVEDEVTCSGDEVLGFCGGQPAGTVFRGIPGVAWQSDAFGLFPPNEYAAMLEDWFAGARLELSDEYGDGGVKLFAIGQRAAGGADEEFLAIATAILETGPATEIRQARILRFLFSEGVWRLRGEIFAAVSFTSEDWLSGQCADCYDHWERWEDDWQTYRNDEYGFEFQHPESCEVEETDGSFSIAGSPGHLDVSDSEGLSLAGYVDRFIDGLNEPYEIESTQRGSVGGRESITVSYRFGGLNRFGTATFVERDASIYRFGFEAGGYTCSFGPEVYGRMLSTFRFIE